MFIPFTALTSVGSIAVLFIYFKIPQTLPVLTLATGGLFGVCLLLGYVLFTHQGEQTDRLMNAWRSPLTELSELAFEWSGLLLAEREGVPVPEELKEWGIENWSDLGKAYVYILMKGEHAKAKDICLRFFKENE